MFQSPSTYYSLFYSMIKLNQFLFYFQLYVQLLLYILCSTCSNPNLYIILHSIQNYPCFFTLFQLQCFSYMYPTPCPHPITNTNVSSLLYRAMLCLFFFLTNLSSEFKFYSPRSCCHLLYVTCRGI